MPIVTTEPFTRPEHVIEFLAGYLSDSTIPLEYVAKYDEPLLPQYPAAQILSGPMEKSVHGTRTFLLTFRAEIYVMHGKMTESRATRNLRDLQLATQVVAYLENDMELGGRIIAGFVESEIPGAMPPRTDKGAPIISTRLSWAGTQEARF